MFGPLLHITLIMQPKFLYNIWKIFHNDISNVIYCLFGFLWPSNGIETQIGNQPLSWSSQITFWLWRCDIHLVHNTKFQRDFQGDVLLAILGLPVFSNIKTTNFLMFICVNSPGVNFSSQSVFQLEQPW